MEQMNPTRAEMMILIRDLTEKIPYFRQANILHETKLGSGTIKMFVDKLVDTEFLIQERGIYTLNPVTKPVFLKLVESAEAYVEAREMLEKLVAKVGFEPSKIKKFIAEGDFFGDRRA